jgi:hypothetical protein
MTSLLDECPLSAAVGRKEVRENRGVRHATRWTQSCPRTGGGLYAWRDDIYRAPDWQGETRGEKGEGRKEKGNSAMALIRAFALRVGTHPG